ncbi:MAG: DUF1501 domain-containing protein [Isosphaeraceae bacterium]|nr:DUF1501 domain-containing protein [Isosphaeraceae bacterium]
MTLMHNLTRRGWLRSAAVAVGAGSMSGWLDAFAADVSAHPQRAKSVILLWMNGGPATIDLWDLKPGHANGGPFRPIGTAVPGLQLSEHLPNLALRANELVVVRSMTTKEGDHGRATQFVKTGYMPQGAIQFPAVGSLLAREIGCEETDLPGFVSIAPERVAAAVGGGFLGPRFAPLVVGGRQGADPDEALKVPNLQRLAGVSDSSQTRRIALLNGLESRFRIARDAPVVDAVRAATAQAIRLMQPEAASAFRLDEETTAVRDSYGRNTFGQGCLLARRLVERGVACVEVTLGGWDTHQNNFEQVKALSGTLDRAFAALLADLAQRGLLDTTLIVCQGEFGRTPKINANTGRDHWPRSWAAVLAGGGLRGGQAVGKTSADGTAVEERPVTVPDLIATVCRSVGVDPTKQNMSNVGRPIRIADPAAKPVQEVL